MKAKPKARRAKPAGPSSRRQQDETFENMFTQKEE